MKSYKYFYVITLIYLLLLPSVIQAINVIPQPYYVQESCGYFDVVNKNNILYNGNKQEVCNIIDRFVEQLRLDYKLILSTDKHKKANIVLQDMSSLSEEEYELEVTTNSVLVKAAKPAGFFYALRTINQLLLADDNHARIPCLVIKDKPRFSYRGFMIDAARHYFPLEDVKKIIDIASGYKLNRLHWHLTDDQGWRIEIKKYPFLTQEGATRLYSAIGTWDQYFPRHYDGKKHAGFYTQKEIREIVKYAADRQIIIIPEIEMPGHSLAALHAYPEYACSFHSSIDMLAGTGISEQVYCPKETTFNFIRDILLEVADMFPGEYIHIGGDECPKKSWMQCVDCQNLIKKENLKNETELHAYFIQQVEKIAKSLGRKLIGWDEILEGGLPLESTVMSWRGEAGGIKAAKLGNNVIMSPNTNCYFDYYQEFPQYAPLAIGGFIPVEKVYRYDPIPSVLSAEEAERIIGVQGNVWGEFIPNINKFEYMAYPRLLAIAEIAWSSSENKDEIRFMKNLEKEFMFFRKKKVNACTAYYRPFITGKWDDTKNMYMIEIKSLCPFSEIRYTLDGTEPTIESRVYNAPFALNSNACIKAILINKEKELLGSPEVRNFLVNKATGCSYKLSNEMYSLDWYTLKPALLTDGVPGFVPSNSEWGAIPSGTEIIIDLKEITSITGISLGTMISPMNNVFPLKSVVCYLSNNGEAFQKITESDFSYPEYMGVKEIYHKSIRLNKAKGRFLKLRVEGQNNLSNLPSLIALDEIEVY